MALPTPEQVSERLCGGTGGVAIRTLLGQLNLGEQRKLREVLWKEAVTHSFSLTHTINNPYPELLRLFPSYAGCQQSPETMELKAMLIYLPGRFRTNGPGPGYVPTAYDAEGIRKYLSVLPSSSNHPEEVEQEIAIAKALFFHISNPNLFPLSHLIE